ncbi:hypothetical protein L596_030089 [Steinernema carpocapsae]|uniref:Uncharacterized protein n=1 Tax=Steinernema carpocapsae TaxID=34508 RepID=A0A4U5LRP3_STECR|nr:hypothetical protein L596_030089 [Steinernema carpocapsae]
MSKFQTKPEKSDNSNPASRFQTRDDVANSGLRHAFRQKLKIVFSDKSVPVSDGLQNETRLIPDKKPKIARSDRP